MKIENLLKSRQTTLHAAEQRVLEDAISEIRVYEARQTIVRREAPLNESLFLVEGLMCRYIDNRNGDRQILSVQLSGDFVDLQGYTLKTLDHNVSTLTKVEIAVFRHKDLDAIVAGHPMLARKLWFATLLDAAMHREWIFKLGRLPSQGRVAHFLCETEIRLRAVGFSDGGTFRIPLTQLDIAEICGLTSIHVNRVIRDLRERRLCTYRGGVVEILDGPGLARLGQFDPAYLYLDAGLTALPKHRRSNLHG